MNLYFLDDDGKQHLVVEDVNEASVLSVVNTDILKRYRHGTILNLRTWWDKYFRMWIELDMGKDAVRYIMQDEKRALNVVHDEEVHKGCGPDYCDI